VLECRLQEKGRMLCQTVIRAKTCIEASSPSPYHRAIAIVLVAAMFFIDKHHLWKITFKIVLGFLVLVVLEITGVYS